MESQRALPRARVASMLDFERVLHDSECQPDIFPLCLVLKEIDIPPRLPLLQFRLNVLRQSAIERSKNINRSRDLSPTRQPLHICNNHNHGRG